MTLTESLVALRRTMGRLLMKRLARETTRPFQQLRLLSAVARGKAETQAQASELLVVDPAAICRLVDRLVEDGLMERRPGKDRRCVRLHLTEAGRAELENLRRSTAWLDELAASILSEEEMKTFVRLADQLQRGLSELHPEERESVSS